MTKTGRPANEGATESFKVTVPKPLHAYLVKLARESYAGASLSEVVSYLLKLKIAELGAQLRVPTDPPVVDEESDVD